MTETPEETIARLTAGADPTPAEPGTWLTPGQWIAQFNASTADQRIEAVTGLMELAQQGIDCITGRHRDKLTGMQRTINTLRELEAHPLRTVHPHTYPADHPSR